VEERKFDTLNRAEVVSRPVEVQRAHPGSGYAILELIARYGPLVFQFSSGDASPEYQETHIEALA
jgi:hypothetical protein